jgi:hypothetical protein
MIDLVSTKNITAELNTMITPRAALAAFWISVSTIAEASVADLPPPPSDQKLAEVFSGAKALMDKSHAPGYLDMPSTVQSWPCEVPELQLRKYASALNDNEMPVKIKVAQRKSTLNAGMTSNEMKTSIRDVNFAPLVATCKDGALEGPLEFLVEYTRVIEGPASVTEIRMRVRKSMTLAAGQPVMQTPSLSASLQLSFKNTQKDPAMQAMMEKIKTPDPTTRSATYSLQFSDDEEYSARIADLGANGWSTVLQRPTGPKRSEVATYKGSGLLRVTPMKNGLAHGEQRTTEQKYGTMIVPAKSDCFEEGEIIQSVKCDVQ